MDVSLSIFIYPFIRDRHLGCFHFLLIQNNAVICEQAMFELLFSVLLGYIHRSEIAGLYSNIVLTFWGTVKLVCKGSCALLCFKQCMKVPNFSTSLLTLITVFKKKKPSLWLWSDILLWLDLTLYVENPKISKTLKRIVLNV